MTTEEDFQARLDAQPEDWQTRLVFADWLQERGDPRADGYRALGRGKHHTDSWGGEGHCFWRYTIARGTLDAPLRTVALPDDWFDLLPREVKHNERSANWGALQSYTRRAAEDAAALAFAKLPAERRAELLAGRLDG